MMLSPGGCESSPGEFMFLDFLKSFLRLLGQTYFPRKGSPARLTVKRAIVMSAFLPVFFLLQCLHFAGFALDEILFRGYRRMRVREPLFIVGVPRSGTTFLHQVLADDTRRFTTLTLWELLLAPSITERRIVQGLLRLDRMMGRPGARVMEWIERRSLTSMDAIHKVSLAAPEEDYLLFVPVFACFLLTHPFPADHELWRLTRFDEALPEKKRRRLMSFYHRCLQRHLYVHGPQKQILSKNPSFTPMIRSLREEFPDCRMICCLRDPVKVVPSLISSMEEGRVLFDNDARGNWYHRRLYNMLRSSYRYLLREIPRAPEDRRAFVKLEEMKQEVAGTVEALYRRFGWNPDEAFQRQLAARDEESRAYRSRHKYAAEDYGIGPAEISRDLAFVRRRFGYESPGGRPDPASTEKMTPL